MQQFAALGYIEDPSADKEKQQESAEIEANITFPHLSLEESSRSGTAVAG